MKTTLITIAILLCNISYGQVSSKDMSLFASELNFRREQNVGENPYSSGFLQVPFGPINFKGVKAVSSKFMFDIYSKEDVDARLVMGLFTTIGLDKVVFDKFILQIFLYSNAEKETTIGLINVLCGDAKLTSRIYTGYLQANAALIAKRLKNNPYAADIKERQAEIDNEEREKRLSEDQQKAEVNTKKTEATLAAPVIFSYVQKMPEAGFDCQTYFANNLKYPDVAKANNIDGRVIVKFVVNEDGTISDIQIEHGIGGGCDEEAIRLVKDMPKWKPGKQNGKPVKVFYSLPVLFEPK